MELSDYTRIWRERHRAPAGVRPLGLYWRCHSLAWTAVRERGHRRAIPLDFAPTDDPNPMRRPIRPPEMEQMGRETVLGTEQGGGAARRGDGRRIDGATARVGGIDQLDEAIEQLLALRPPAESILGAKMATSTEAGEAGAP